MSPSPVAPALQVSAWLNTPAPITLSDLSGKVVLLEFFQMLCPGCVAVGLPQAGRARAVFSADTLAVIGVHSVFEHHQAQGSEAALAAFLHEYRIGFPVGIDRHASGRRLPNTMAAYDLQGTPSTVLIDRNGRLRACHFGQVSDMRLAAKIQALIDEDVAPPLPSVALDASSATGCGPDFCPIPPES